MQVPTEIVRMLPLGGAGPYRDCEDALHRESPTEIVKPYIGRGKSPTEIMKM